MDTTAKFFLPAAGFLLTVAAGIWLSRLGRPYNGGLFNVHKLVALAVVVLTIVQLVRMLRGGDPQVTLVILLVLAAACVVALVLTGAFLSAGKFSYPLLRTIHAIAPVLLAAVMAGLIYLLA